MDPRRRARPVETGHRRGRRGHSHRPSTRGRAVPVRRPQRHRRPHRRRPRDHDPLRGPERRRIRDRPRRAPRVPRRPPLHGRARGTAVRRPAHLARGTRRIVRPDPPSRPVDGAQYARHRHPRRRRPRRPTACLGPARGPTAHRRRSAALDLRSRNRLRRRRRAHRHPRFLAEADLDPPSEPGGRLGAGARRLRRTRIRRRRTAGSDRRIRLSALDRHRDRPRPRRDRGCRRWPGHRRGSRRRIASPRPERGGCEDRESATARS
jgi:hypothetical protein